MRKNKKGFLIGLVAVLVVTGLLLLIPPIWSRVSYYANQLYTDIFYKLNPPSEVVFQPGQSTPDDIATSVSATLTALIPSLTPEVNATPLPSPTPTATQIPLPPARLLSGIKQEAQMFNNCGPATLSMTLSFWNWNGNQSDTAEILKPNQQDKNVMPYEIVDYVNEHTEYKAIVRMGGDLYTLKSLINAGFPVLVEKGFEPENLAKEGWMGHYNLVIGYDDEAQGFTTQDSYLLAVDQNAGRDYPAGYIVSYQDMQDNWRAFNNVFIVVYRPEYENDVLNALGVLADETASYQLAYARAQTETTSLTEPRDRFFAWFNAGTSLVKLQDYSAAAGAFDAAFSIYPTIEEKYRPYRMLWYQTGPYYAYYYTGRYQDVIDLATSTLDAMSSPILEESFHWRALAEDALGNRAAAVEDLRKALEVHPGFGPSYEQLRNFGETP